MTIAGALERFNEYIRVGFLEWHISLLKRRMEKMEIEKEAQHIKAAEARSTCKECEEYDHVQGKPRFNASSSIQDLVSLFTQFKDFMDEQAKINKDVVTKFEGIKKILKNLDGKVTEVGSSIHEVFIVMKCERCKWDNLPNNRWVTKENIRDNPKVPRRRRLLKLVRERWRIALRRP
jgi:predicted nucleic-acid-binding Zn-ribbon protein